MSKKLQHSGSESIRIGIHAMYNMHVLCASAKVFPLLWVNDSVRKVCAVDFRLSKVGTCELAKRGTTGNCIYIYVLKKQACLSSRECWCSYHSPDEHSVFKVGFIKNRSVHEDVAKIRPAKVGLKANCLFHECAIEFGSAKV